MKFLFTLLLSITTFGAFAQSNTKPTAEHFAGEPDQVEVATKDLPEPVKNVITEKYKEWKLMAAYVYNTSPEYYQLKLKKGEEEQTLSVDAKGNELSLMLD
ncbi:MAG: hypothetical protein EOP51_03730 [Sphingobacteriales bacterium]|nr:MAG: hypothetical protein EOP51_03730 [Sphingobacteriales bacterium]